MSETKRFQFSIRDLIGFTIACSLFAFAFRVLPRDTATLVAAIGVLYVTKFYLNQRVRPPVVSILCYVASCGVALACVYSTTWNSPDVSMAFNLFIVPLTFLALPTVTFVLDVRRVPMSSINFVLRSMIEICVALPVWYAACMFFAYVNGMFVVGF